MNSYRVAGWRDDGAEAPITRRGFCNGLLLGSAGVFVANAMLDGCVMAQGPGLARLPVKVAGAEALMPGSSLLFNYPGKNDPAILVRTPDGDFHAYSQKCSHFGCSVQFERNLCRLECPCHKGAYDVKNGFVVSGPPQQPLDEIILQTRGGEVWAVGKRTNEPLIASQRS